MPYPKGFLESRAVIKAGIYTIIPPEGRVINSIPGFEGCKLTIIASPKHGASFSSMSEALKQEENNCPIR